MAKTFYKNLFGSSNYAGLRPSGWKPKGVVIHNDAGSSAATATWYMNSYLPGIIANGTAGNGYAHYYCDEDLIFQCCDTRYGAWATANTDGNMNYVSYEVCQSMGDLDRFKRNEQACFKQVAEDLKYWGLTPNRDTVRLHREFFSTACPHRSYDIHGKSVNAVKDYFISQIKKYMNGEEETKKDEPATYYHTKRIKKIITKKVIDMYDSYALSKAKKVASVPAGKILKVLDIWKQGDKSTDMSRFKVEYNGKTGWVTGNDDYIESAYYLNAKYGDKTKVKILKDGYAYQTKELDGRKTAIKKGDVYTITDNITDKAGYPRLKLKSGMYISALKSFSQFV